MFCIYQIRNVNNGRRYIGQTSDMGHRVSCHRYELSHGIHKSRRMQADYDEDPDSLVFEVVCECSQEELDGLERYFIERYDTVATGYNVSPGRTANGGNEASDETRRKLSESKMGNQHMRGKHLSEEWKRNLAKAQPHKRAVRCVDTGEVFESFADAARKTGLNRTKIVAVCTGTRKTTGGLRFEYAGG